MKTFFVRSLIGWDVMFESQLVAGSCGITRRRLHPFAGRFLEVLVELFLSACASRSTL